MNSELEKAHDYLIETAGHLSNNLGLSGTAGQLYALLYLSPEPISLKEMVEMLKISKASASVNIRALEGWGAAKKVWVKGNRRDHYIADRDIWKITISRMKIGLERRISETGGAIDTAEKMLKKFKNKSNGSDKKLAEIYLNRVNELKKLSEKLQGLLKFIPENL